MSGISDIKFEEEVEKLINMMLEKKLIQGDANTLKQTVMDAVKGAVGDTNDFPDIIKNPVLRKKVESIAICASIEANLDNNKLLKPGLKNTFNTNELAKAEFSPEMQQEQAKKIILAFTLALMPTAHGKTLDKVEYEKLAEQMTANADIADERALNDQLSLEFAKYLYMQQEFNYMQAFGSTQDGTPVYITTQKSNEIGATDMFQGKRDDAGYLKIDNDPNNPNIDPTIKEKIVENELELGILEPSTAPTLTLKLPGT